MAQRHREVRNDFSGGFNSRDSEALLEPNESPDMLNVIVGKRGMLKPRPGTTLFNKQPVSEPLEPDAANPPVTSIYEFVNQGGTAFFIAFAGESLKRSDVVEGWHLIEDGFTKNTQLEFVTHPVVDRALFVNGEDGYWETDGMEADEVDPYEPTEDEKAEIGNCSIPTKPKLIEYHDYTVWIGNVEGFPDRVYYNVHDLDGNILYNYFTAWSWLRPREVRRGEPITALKSFRGNLYVFTRTTITLVKEVEPFTIEGEVYAPPMYEMQTVSSTIGAVSQRTVQELNDRMIFLGVDGVYMFDGVHAPFKVSQRVGPTFRSARRDFWYQACGVVHEDKYLVSFPTTVIIPEG